MACCAGSALAQQGRPQALKVPPEVQRQIFRPFEEGPRLPSGPPDRLLEIPPVVDRPFSAEEGERVRVEIFRVTGAQDHPAQGVYVSDIRRLLEKERRKQGEGFTIGQMETIAGKVTNYYRERGLILAQAVIPEQKVEHGIVTVRVIEGKLGRVVVEGNEMYAQDVIKGAFSGQVGKAVTRYKSQSGLLALLDYPGLTAFGMFKPGRRVGESDLLVRVRDEQMFGGNVRLDNHGTETTGQFRARGQLHWNNITGNADRLGVTLQGSLDPANSLYAATDYALHYGRLYEAGLYGRYNEFAVGGQYADLEIEGVTQQYGLSVTRYWLRGRNRTLSSDLKLAHKRTTTERLGSQANEERLTVLNVGLDYESVDTRFNGLNYAGLELRRGFNGFLGAMGDAETLKEKDFGEQPSRRGGSGELAEGAFTKVRGYLSRLQTINEGSTLLVRLEAQYSPDLLVPLEQYSVGGADNVRAFPSSHQLFDHAALLSAEYLVRAPGFANRDAFGHYQWGDLVQFSAFYDHAWGRLNDPLPSEIQDTAAFAGAGIGARFKVPGRGEARLQFAWPTTDDSPGEEEVTMQIWGDATYRF